MDLFNGPHETNVNEEYMISVADDEFEVKLTDVLNKETNNYRVVHYLQLGSVSS